MTTPDNNFSAAIKGSSLWATARRKLMRDKAAMICLGIIVIYVLIAIGGYVYEYLADRDPKDNIPSFSQMSDFKHPNKAPSFDSWRNIMGTDWEGNPVIVKTLLGAKVALVVGFFSNLIAIPLGMILGVIAGYFGRRIDDFIVWLYTTCSSIPGIVLLISLKFAFSGKVLFRGTFCEFDLGGIPGLCVAFAITSWVGTCRLVRAETMKLRELDYVLAAKAIGRRSLPILSKHIIPNLLHLGIINFSLGFVYAITAEVMLSYLGLGVPVGTPSWGSMINSAREDLFQGRWWEVTSAVTAMFFLILALNIFGDRLRDALDPRLKNV